MPVYGRPQRILKKLPRTFRFGPRQMLLATMRERQSMFWSLSSWLFSLVVFVVFVVFVVVVVHLFQCPVDVAIPAGMGGKRPCEKDAGCSKSRLSFYIKDSGLVILGCS